jgi:dihydrofolate reductase
MSLIGIAACTKNGIIGVNGAIPWHYKEDFAFFKFMTTGHAVVMGGNTYRSIGKPLPNRKNIVFTRKGGEDKDNIKFIDLVDGCCCVKAIEHYMFENEDIYIIGGGEIYDMFFSYIDKWIITTVEDELVSAKDDKIAFIDIEKIKSEYKKLAEIKLSDKCSVIKYDKLLK